uniref:Uncharacterized protein n=1 Tax=Coptotermes formosanus TaxID=36987 RepID=R4UXB7_COPFO|nr:hypothetical protein [Coptotermes formosanus]
MGANHSEVVYPSQTMQVPQVEDSQCVGPRKLYIKHKWNTRKEKIEISDEAGNVRWFSEDHSGAFKRELHVLDPVHHKLWAILRHQLSIHWAYDVEFEGHTYKLVKKFLGDYELEGTGWKCVKKFLGNEVELTDGAGVIMLMTRHFGSDKELSIFRHDLEVPAICLAMIVDIEDRSH